MTESTTFGFGIISLILIVGAIVALVFFLKYLSRKHKGTKVSKPIKTPLETKATDKDTSKGSIFISYRREDSAGHIGRIYDRLVAHFGKSTVFEDVDSIPLGVDFRTHIEQFIEKCSVVIAVIGSKWILAEDKKGNTRLQSPHDHVRVELETALKRDIPVIPIFIDNAVMPDEDDLPESLKQLVYRNGVSVRSTDPDFNYDMDRLINGIKSHL